jgi:hypothetical protein
MADQVSVDSEKQAAATTNVVESGQAVTSSAQGASSLGAAQKSMFWGQEAGPQNMGHSSAKLFDTVSDVLAKEAALISTFEAEINAALESFTGTEQDNKLQLAKIREALNRVDKSDAAAEAKAARHKFDKTIGQIESAVQSLFSGSSGSGQSSTTDAAGTAGAAGAALPTTGGSTTQAPTQGAQPEV